MKSDKKLMGIVVNISNHNLNGYLRLNNNLWVPNHEGKFQKTNPGDKTTELLESKF